MRLAVVFLLVEFTLVLIAPLIAPHDPMQTDVAAQFQPPSSEHLLGTDMLGRDVFSRILYGGQRTLVTAVSATVAAVILGTLLGLASSVSNPWLSRSIRVFIEALLAFPSLLVAFVVLTVLGAGQTSLAVAVGFVSIAPYAQVTHSSIVSTRSAHYVEAAKAVGATDWQVLWRHIVPNIQFTLLAYAGVTFAYSLLNGAALSFLGLGGEPGIADWGVMLWEGRGAFRAAPWISFVPGFAITATVFAVNSLSGRRRFQK